MHINEYILSFLTMVKTYEMRNIIKRNEKNVDCRTNGIYLAPSWLQIGGLGLS